MANHLTEMSGDACSILLIIDPQIDFHEGGSLAVPGASEDSIRIAQLIELNSAKLDKIIVSLDTHSTDHIAFPKFWKNINGEQPTPFTVIEHQDVLSGKWLPSNRTLLEYALKYTLALEENGRFQLIVWPYHCIQDSEGHKVVSSIATAIQAWREKYPSRTYEEIEKGMDNLTEMYSVLKAEVPLEGNVGTHFNTALMAQLKTCTKLVIGGQAQSHCVNYTTRDIINQWDADRMADIIFLRDGSSPVPGYEAQASALFDYLHQVGVTVADCNSLILP